MLAVSDHCPIFHMFQHKFQEDLFHDLIGSRGEADWLVIPMVLLFSFQKKGVMFPFYFQLLGN